jgi:putative resolvase
MANYLPARKAQEKLGVTLRTLLRWAEAGKIETIKTPGGQNRYNVESVLKSAHDTRWVALYSRVSSYAQRPHLEQQSAFLVKHFPDGQLIEEVGSGLNFKRKKLLSLLESVLSGDVRLVVVAHKDRLARFGFDLIQWFCQRKECRIVVLNQVSLSPEREMVEDILAIIHVFSCRLYGLRKYKRTLRDDAELQPVPDGSLPRTGGTTKKVG